MGTTERGGATIYEVAAHAGVSIATVSRALKRPEVVAASTRERVNAAIAELNYLPDGAASSLAARRHDAQGLIVPELTGLYFAELLAGYENALSDLGQNLILMITSSRSDVDGAVREMAARVDGLAVLGPAGLSEHLVTSLAERMPVIIAAGQPCDNAALVHTDNFTPAYDVTKRLLDQGRERICFIGNPQAAVDVQARYDGYVQAHRERGVKPAEALVCDFTEQGGRDAAEVLVARKVTPDALVCANDLIAIALMRQLQSEGYAVPDDIAITGWDDVMTARYMTPALTSVAQPVRDLAAYMAHQLHARAHGLVSDEEWATPYVLSSELTLRDSCGTRKNS